MKDRVQSKKILPDERNDVIVTNRNIGGTKDINDTLNDIQNSMIEEIYLIMANDSSIDGIDMMSNDISIDDKRNIHGDWSTLQLSGDNNRKVLIIVVESESDSDNYNISKQLYRKNLYHLKYNIRQKTGGVPIPIDEDIVASSELSDILLAVTSGLYRFINKVVISSNPEIIKSLMLMTPYVINKNKDTKELCTSYILVDRKSVV